MAETIKVSATEISALAEKIKTGVQEMERSFKSINTTFEKVEGYWKSKSWSSTYEDYCKLAEKITPIMSEMNAYPKELSTCVSSYKNTEKHIKSKALALPSDIIK